MKNKSKLILLGLSLPIAISAGYFFFNNQVSSNQSESFRQAVNKAMNAAVLTQKAQSQTEWQQVVNDWKSAIALMKDVPSSFPKYNISQQKIIEYEKKLKYAHERLQNTDNVVASPTPFRDAVNKAMSAAILTQKAKTQTEWQQVVNDWKKAIALMKIVPTSFERYNLAPVKVKEYQRNLDYALIRLNMAKKDSKNNDSVATKTPEPDNKEQSFNQGINLANTASELGKKAQSQTDWETVIKKWQDAISNMESIPKTSDKYNLAQERIKTYEKNVELAQTNLSNSTSLMQLKTVISGKITPKSVVYSGEGLFFAQNMMYSHTITVYDRQYNLVKTIPDKVDLSKYGYAEYKGEYQGAPVEVAFSHQGKYAWVSNYQMYGKGFNNPGSDQCSPSSKLDESFIYKINTQNMQIEQVIKVGAVPKYLAVSHDNKYLLVTNWCGWNLSIINTETNTEIKRVKLGAYPRGIVVDKDSQNAYVAVMGSSDIAQVKLADFSVNWLRGIGRGPRHLNIDPESKYLYATLNNEGTVAKIDLTAKKLVKKVTTGAAPRSMVMSDDGKFLYVVNYNSNTVSKLRTIDMKVIQNVKVNSHPIGITYDPEKKQVWVACYSGSIMVFAQ
jgi:YVTN family beta-propeller protein